MVYVWTEALFLYESHWRCLCMAQADQMPHPAPSRVGIAKFCVSHHWKSASTLPQEGGGAFHWYAHKISVVHDSV